ncbi:MAG: four-helix bundle copper-binding protein [Phycisphaerae bacterium]|nr:four-helix bundle copper-binding protein [Phycisphaerae bacterium]
MTTDKYKDCIEACNACAVACEYCATACLQGENVQMLVRCIAMNRDCAKLCYTASGFMAAGSEFSEDICATCSDICQACADECRQHKHDHCQQCADVCERCAKECEKMATADIV